MHLEALLKYPTMFLAAFLATYALTPLFILFAPRLGLMDIPDARRIHRRPTPRGAGLCIVVGFHAACALLYFFPWAPFDGIMGVAWWRRFLPASLCLVGLGLADDRWNLRPATKFAGQVAVCLLAFSAGIRMVSIMGAPLPVALDMLLTVAWLLAIINAFNLIDGIDGLATGLGLIACVGLGLSFFLRRLPGDVLLALSLAGACLAFLRFNFSPARAFLGDTGSMFLGFAVASMALTTSSKGAAATSLVLPVFAAGVPLFDAALAVWRRLARRFRGHANGEATASLAQGDLDHLHHRMIHAGLSHSRAAAGLYALSGTLVAVGVLLAVFDSHTIGISLAAFTIGTYVVVRHLARIELWDTGAAIVQGLHRPPRRAWNIFLHPLFDVAVLSAATLGSAVLNTAPLNRDALRNIVLTQGPVWTAVPFIAIALANNYRRVWSRASVSEFVILCFSLAGGILAAAALESTFHPQPWREVATRMLVFAGLAAPAVIGSRLIGQAAQDVMARARARRPTPDASGRQPGAPPEAPPPSRALIYGAGFRAMLFLRERAMNPIDAGRRRQIVGIIDDDENLQGRLVYGCRVVGTARTLRPCVARLRADEIVIAADLPPETRAGLLRGAAELHLRVAEWSTGERDVFV